MDTAKFVFKRILMAIFTIFVAATITFFLMKLVPGSPFASEKANEIAQQALNEKYGLDKPVFEQYKIYLQQLLHGDLGVSYKLQRNVPVMTIIKQSFPISAKIGAMSIIFAILFGIPLGCLSALKREKWQDSVIRVISTLGIAVPSFVIATASMLLFAIQLKILPTYGLSGPSSYILPVFTLGFYPMCYITRLMRSSMLDALGQDYIRTARAKGMSEFVVTFKHALKNSLIPVITYLGPLVAFTLVGGFVVEKVFNIPGLGRYFIKAIDARDYNIIMGTTVFLATFVILMNLLCDVLYKLVDPRIKLDD
ncbi:MAG: ABC transporter permease [Terrisporobacter othiniensis]|uniref:ABC transporter permease n=1 Tax=Terrisporobacter hibernicus TaxID=2813371 RepID=A0AAX2ZHI9_9FIRM|nr:MULTISPECIES: ABC transporter permease [Terrisporobacter]MDU4860416.1 ABC transporter permease [Terrisporobacter othiniensis]UPA31481.1 ABC transporter permease [Terrisporobacter glycolicus]MDU6993355.1 ABC transporter permease [Terrisporobacter othiniensis]UEL48511.1 ABC transporter permease [Terrisporobacter hibernicus]SFJ36033.1 oligopeptide transport system permease protein [Terrisporobacter glycolicus]